MNSFIFDKFSFDRLSLRAEFHYRHTEPELKFKEIIEFDKTGMVNSSDAELEQGLILLFYLLGVSYFKAFPTADIKFNSHQPDAWQQSFLANVYTDGLSQFIFENNLSLEDFPFAGSQKLENLALPNYQNLQKDGVLALQSGGKDSLLTAKILESKIIEFKPFNMPYGNQYPSILDSFNEKPRFAKRIIDKETLSLAAEQGGLNGHVPVTYITSAIATVDAIIHGEKWVVLSVGQEGNEAHEYVDRMAVNHQWSKTWEAEKLFANYIYKYLSQQIVVGSLIRKYSELKIAEIFVQKCWDRYGSEFSSCNKANYLQGAKNTKLKWCGNCPKCANSYLLFAPFVDPDQLNKIIGSDMLGDKAMADTFKGLLGIDGFMKPFECVGEVLELRLAYHMAQKRWGDKISKLKFQVPSSDFNYNKTYDYNKAFDTLL